MASKSQGKIVGVSAGGNRKRYFTDLFLCLGAGSRTDLNRDATGPDWVRDYAKQQQKQKLLQEKADMEARLAKIRDRERKESERENSGIVQRAKKRVHISSCAMYDGGSYMKMQKEELEVDVDGDDEESRFRLNEYDSEEEGEPSASNTSSSFSPAVLELMKKYSSKSCSLCYSVG